MHDLSQEESIRIVKELNLPCMMVISWTPLYWFLFSRLVSRSLSKEGWSAAEKELMEEFLDGAQSQIKELSPYAAELMREGEDAE